MIYTTHDRRLPFILINLILVILFPSITYSAPPGATFVGSLADFFCVSQGDMKIDHAEIRADEVADCHAVGGLIRITELVAQSGSRFNAASHPPGALIQATYPPEMPDTPLPEFKGCSNEQEDFLRKAWRRGHFFTWRAYKDVNFIQSAPVDMRPELWDKKGVSEWFGSYDNDRAEFVDKALYKALARFEMRGKVVKKIRTIRCGSPTIPKEEDEHIDVCPGNNPGGDGPPSAYHFPVGIIVTCPVFWERANDTKKYIEDRFNSAGRAMVHEIFHWLSVNGLYVVDYHGDGIGGLEDGKYYGHDKAIDLAKVRPSWAIRNNDNYAFFARDAGLAAIEIKIVK